MKKVLIITYYWIPSGGAGVQRWVKFTKYLREFGWEPIIYTPENPEYPSEDLSFSKDIPADITILKKPIWEPYNIYRSLFGKKGEKINAGLISENKKTGWKEKLSIWIRGNFLIPDPRRFWIKPSVNFLTDYLKKNPVDAIVSTGPPHSMHFIGLGLKKNYPNLPWIADFRDSWTNLDFYEELNLSYISDKIHHIMEKKIIRSADTIVVVSNGMREEYELLKPKNIKVITNGYDESDIQIGDIKKDEKFSISHIGTLNSTRNPQTLWKVLSEICTENPEFKADLQIQLIGKVDFSVLEEINLLNFSNNLLKVSYLSHKEAIIRQQSSQVLLLLINQSVNAKGFVTGKFFEYLAAKRPILAIGPTDGDVAAILSETSAGKIVGFNDYQATKKTVIDLYLQYKSGKLNVDTKSIDRYSRKSLTGELSKILNSL